MCADDTGADVFVLSVGTDHGHAGHDRPMAMGVSLPALRSPMSVWRAVRAGEVEA
jgi:hypothetical protein